MSRYNVWARKNDEDQWFLRHKGLSRLDAEELPRPPGHETRVIKDGIFPNGSIALTDRCVEVIALPDAPRDMYAVISGDQWVFGHLERGVIHCSACDASSFRAVYQNGQAFLRCDGCGRELEAR